MIVFKDRSWQQMSGHPDDNYLAAYNCEQPQWVVNDNSELANKIISADNEWEPVESEKGELVDIVSATGEQTAADEDREILTEPEKQEEEIREQIAELEQGEE